MVVVVVDDDVVLVGEAKPSPAMGWRKPPILLLLLLLMPELGSVLVGENRSLAKSSSSGVSCRGPNNFLGEPMLSLKTPSPPALRVLVLPPLCF